MRKEVAEHIAWMQEKYQEMFVSILNQLALIEDKIDEIITLTFFKNQEVQWDFVDIILGDILLSQKIIKLQRTLKVLNPEIFEDFQAKNVKKRFDKVRKLRNAFAHSILNTQPEYVSKMKKDEIALFNFRYNPPHVQVVLSDFENSIQETKEIFRILDGYCQETRNKYQKDEE